MGQLALMLPLWNCPSWNNCLDPGLNLALLLHSREQQQVSSAALAAAPISYAPSTRCCTVLLQQPEDATQNSVKFARQCSIKAGKISLQEKFFPNCEASHSPLFLVSGNGCRLQVQTIQ